MSYPKLDTKPARVERNTIIYGNCVKKLRTLPSAYIDLIVCAPPLVEQDPEWTCVWMGAAKRVLTPAASVAIVMPDTATWWNAVLDALQAEGWDLVDQIAWIKPDAPNASETVFVLALTPNPYVNRERYAETFGKTTGGVIYASLAEIDRRCISAKFNPGQFPVSVPEAIIRTHCGRRGVVLDPFMGAGNTAIAAMAAGRSFLGIDSSGAACCVARRRVKEVRDARIEKSWTEPLQEAI